MSRQESKHLALAKKVAAASEERNRHGAVIVKNGRVISIGINKFRNHPTIIEENKISEYCSVHAEVDAISRAKVTDGATIYVARVNRRGQERFSRPCDNCYLAIKKAGINKIIFTEGES